MLAGSLLRVSNVILIAIPFPSSAPLSLLRAMIPANAPILISLVATAYLAIVYLVLTIAQRTRRLRRP